jgi:hypothetical protein
MIEILAVLSASAAAGMRIALPLLVIGLLYGNSLWSRVPLLCRFQPQLVLGVLVSWSLVELVVSKDRFSQRLLLGVQLLLSPIVGAILAIAIAEAAALEQWLVWLLGGVGGLLALVLQLVQVGWSYRLGRLPLWGVFLQDALCVLLVLLALDAPSQGGLIALLLLWLAIRSSKEWHRWYHTQGQPGDRSSPRRYKRDPD